MIKFKVLVIQRGKAFIAYPNDVKRGKVKLEDGDNVSLEQVWIEFTYNNVRLGEIH